MKKFKYFLAVFSLVAGMLMLGSVLTKFGINPIPALSIGLVVTFIGSLAQASIGGAAFNSISYSSPTTITGPVYEEVMTEILLVNNTLKRNLVRFIDNVKANVPIRSIKASVTFQSYSSGAPSSSGSITPSDKLITPYKGMFYQEFDYETLRGTPWGIDMKSGALNIVADEFTKQALALIGPKQSLNFESMFWNGATSATKTAVAALTAGTAQNSVGTAEQTYVAAAPTNLIDGVLTKLIYNTSAVGTRYKVAGTTVTSSNLKTEVDKVYAAISTAASKLLNPENVGELVIYMPHENRALIEIYNNNPSNYKNAFIPTSDGFFTYNGIPIEFVPLPANSMIAGVKMDFVWATDLTDDSEQIKVDVIAPNREDFFIKTIATIESWIFNQNEKVVYVG
jgi:hypothetical protein